MRQARIRVIPRLSGRNVRWASWRWLIEAQRRFRGIGITPSTLAN